MLYFVVSSHFAKATTCTCCDKLIRTGSLENVMDLLEYFQSAMLRSLPVARSIACTPRPKISDTPCFKHA